MAPYVTTSGDVIYSGWIDGTATTTNVVWRTWNSTAVTAATAIGQPWVHWTGTFTTSANTTAANWITWTDGYTTPVQRTPEELAADAERARIAAAEREERQARERADREQAVQRAETLLHAHLNDRQRRALKAHGRFRVKSMSGRWYEIGRGHHGQLKELGPRGKPVNHLCVYATGGLPDADQMLAQKLYLESAEDNLRKVAYVTAVRVPA